MTGSNQDTGTTRHPGYSAISEYGRDGVSGLATLDRGMRGRDVSRPTDADTKRAEAVIEELLARVEGRRRRR